MLVLSTVAIATPTAAQENDGTQAVQTLADGEDLYLVFGADLENTTLEEYIETHARDEVEQNATAEVVQYQDVDQVNVNQQGNATSISIDNGTATAVQEANQQNSNSQAGEATAENRAGDVSNTQFEDVGNVYVVVGDNGQQFDGWGIADKKGDKADTVTQEAQATVTQYQEAEQANVNQQNTAFAIAENESEATAIQQSYQYNENLQEGAANATNVYETDGDGDGDKHKKSPNHYQMTYDWRAGESASAGQFADATVEQSQEVDQANVNEQTAAVAIAVGENATATAVQFTEQSNLNAQLGTAEAINALDATSGMNVATAGAAADEIVSQETETVDGHDKKKKSGDDGGDDGAEQRSDAEVTQYQSAEQLNVNMQSSAIAIATNGSEAAAVQLAYQQNYNAQAGYADAVTVGGSSHGGAVYTEETSVTLAGESANDSLVTFDVAGENYQTNDVDQQANAQIEQAQFVAQENFNEQQGAVAVADGEGETASAVQLSMQENENLQYAAVGAVAVPATP